MIKNSDAYKMFLTYNENSVNIFQVIMNNDRVTETKMVKRTEDMGKLHRVVMKGKNS